MYRPLEPELLNSLNRMLKNIQKDLDSQVLVECLVSLSLLKELNKIYREMASFRKDLGKFPCYEKRKLFKSSRIVVCKIKHQALGILEKLYDLEPRFLRSQDDRSMYKANQTLWRNEFDRFVEEEAFSLAKLRKEITGFSWDVDHMIPLRSKTASGLHNGHNLQVIPSYLNRSKGAKMIYTEPFEWMRAV